MCFQGYNQQKILRLRVGAGGLPRFRPISSIDPKMLMNQQHLLRAVTPANRDNRLPPYRL